MILGVTFAGASNTSIGSVSVTTDSRVFTLTDDHPEFANILEMLKQNRLDEAEAALDRATAVRAAVAQSKFVIDGNVVVFDGRDLPTVMAEYIIRMHNEGFDLGPLEKFTENLYQNPSFRAINEAFRFITSNKMPITEDGCFIGYRTVTEDYKDIRTRTFDNSVGSVVKEPRNLVDENPDITCSNGLHVCSLGYINGAGAGYGGSSNPWIIVKVNPRDVVAVPRDYNDTKLRCCEFVVIGELDKSKIKPEDKKSYREDKAVFQETDAELIAAKKFYELGQKHAKNNKARGSGDPLTSASFNGNNHDYNVYIAGYDGRTKPVAPVATPAPVAATPAVGGNAGHARKLFNEGRYTDLINFKKEKRVGFGRLGFTVAEEQLIEQNRNVNGIVAAPIFSDALGYVVASKLVFDAHGYDQYGFRRSGRNRKGQTRGDIGIAKATATSLAAHAVAAPALTNTQRRVIDLVNEHLGVDAEIDDSLLEDLGADSLDVVELIMAFEEEFQIEISDDEADKASDIVREVAALIDTHLNARRPTPAPVAVTPVTVVTTAGKSANYVKGFNEGQAATRFLPTQTGGEYWTGFCDAWAKNPNNTNR